MIMQYKSAHAQNATEIRTDKNETGRILDYFMKLDLF